jgi:hypothetical protein
MFINFDPRKSPLGVDPLPKGGAIIGVLAADDMPDAASKPYWLRTLRNWAVAEAQRQSVVREPVITDVAFPPEAEVSNAITTAYEQRRFSPDEQAQHHVWAYWEFRKKFFGAYLTYVKGDRKGALIEKTFWDTIRSIRPLRK